MVVTLEEAKAQLRVDTADDDALITLLIGAAADMVGNWLSRDLTDSEPDAIKAAVTMLVAHWYINTEAAMDRSITQLHLGVQEMLAPYRVVLV